MNDILMHILNALEEGNIDYAKAYICETIKEVDKQDDLLVERRGRPIEAADFQQRAKW